MLSLAPKILLVDDDELFGAILVRVAREGGIALTHLTSPRPLSAGKVRGVFELLIIDYDLQNVTGAQVVRGMEEARYALPTLLVTSYGKLPSRLSLPSSIVCSVPKSEGPQKILLRAVSLSVRG